MARNQRAKVRKSEDYQTVWLFRYWSASDQKTDCTDWENSLLMCEINPAPFACYIGLVEGIPTVTNVIAGDWRHPGQRAAIEAAQSIFGR